jgi:hypothetical protein
MLKSAAALAKAEQGADICFAIRKRLLEDPMVVMAGVAEILY